MDSKTLLSVRSATLRRGEVRALRNFSFTVRRGEHWAVLGPNGSGKSSLIQMLQGRLWPEHGSLELLGRRFGSDDIDALRCRIAWAGQETEAELPPWQSVADIAASGALGTLGLQFGPPSPIHRRAASAALRSLGISRLAKRPLSRLSQGQRRLAVIARALAQKPAMLILDEPCSGLDPVARARFLRRLERLLRPDSRPLLLYITHHPEEILPGITHVLLLRGGRAVAAGPKADVLSPARLRAAFGARLQVSRRDGRYWIRLGDAGL